MSMTVVCRRCGGTIVKPAFEGDGVYGDSTCKCNHPDIGERKRDIRATPTGWEDGSGD